jgi:1-acyl-sn-glycerol-3-phosphate acyltransferase
MSARQPLVLTERPVKLQGHAAARAALKAAGWQLNFGGLPAKQGVLIVYPHTSNWDLVVGIFAKWGMGLPATFFGKDTLFKVPVLGAWLRWVGGMPVDRGSPQGVVGQMVERLQQARQRDEFFWLVIAPEGTRSHGSHWRSGFYQVALKAAAPLGLAYIDFGRKQVGVDDFLSLSGDQTADMAAIAAHLGHRTGKRPDQAAPIRLRDDTP